MFLTLYHGSNVEIKKFDPKFLNTGTGNQELGTGFYFTDSIDVASGYGKYIHECKVRIGNKLDVNKEGKLHPQTIEFIIKNAPNYKETLENFGEIDREGFYKVLHDAIDIYNTGGRISTVLFNLEKDFYDGYEYRFNQILYRTRLKLNCIYEKRENMIYNIFFPDQIKILRVFEV